MARQKSSEVKSTVLFVFNRNGYVATVKESIAREWERRGEGVVKTDKGEALVEREKVIEDLKSKKTAEA